MAPSRKVSSSPGGVVGTAIRPRSVGTLPTNSGRAKFRFLLNEDNPATRRGRLQNHVTYEPCSTTPNPAEKLAKLRAEHRATRDKGEADRTKVVVRLATGWMADEVAEVLQVDPNTARNQFTCYREGGIHYSLLH